MKRIWIVGAGGFAVELFSWLRDLPETEGRFAGFIDDFAEEARILERVGAGPGAYPTVKADAFAPGDGDLCLCGLGQPQAKAKLVPEWKRRGWRFMTMVHPAAIVGANVRIGEGCVLCPRSIVAGNATLGDFSALNCGAFVGHDASVGRYSVLAPYAVMTGHTEIGERVMLGTHAALAPRTRVGDDAVVGLGSVALTRVKPGVTVFGVPGKML